MTIPSEQIPFNALTHLQRLAANTIHIMREMVEK
jgi:hypothetical protein